MEKSILINVSCFAFKLHNSKAEGRRQKAEGRSDPARSSTSLLPTPYSLLPTPYSLCHIVSDVSFMVG
ncbi:MAG: hypothetical protein F6J98_05040 [Moorea sp. SIO4G2]|uniref:hypothetical protein n=1 Tax=Moorena bouillonii TaxID=207920 RepID=UPI00117DF8CD|nr:hypothetical protein [Moorena bouillonii]NEO59809.1 hypothetical protein [Moorena sp. SIO4G2]